MVTTKTERILETFLTLVKTDSGTLKEAQMADVLQQMMEEMGFTCERDEAGVITGSNTGNLICRLSGTVKGRPLFLCAHMDRVTPGTGVKPVVKDGYVYSDGTTILAADDCGGLTGIVEGIRHALEAGVDRPDIEVVFTIAEEGGLHGARHLDLTKLKAKECYVLDSSTPAGSLIVKAPASASVEITVIGKAAHGGVAPEKGISALVVAAHALTKLRTGRIDEETTSNLGVARGGEATNIVMERFFIKGDARSTNMAKLDEQCRHIEEVFTQTAAEWGARVELNIQKRSGAVNLTENDSIVQRSMAAFRAAGIEPVLRATGGGSDANMFNMRGMLALNHGCGYTNAHGLDEKQSIEDLEKLVRFTVELVKLHAADLA
jgi:tripeptide aminopeptidase